MAPKQSIFNQSACLTEPPRLLRKKEKNRIQLSQEDLVMLRDLCNRTFLRFNKESNVRIIEVASRETRTQ